jgi:hypothetical protein
MSIANKCCVSASEHASVGKKVPSKFHATVIEPEHPIVATCAVPFAKCEPLRSKITSALNALTGVSLFADATSIFFGERHMKQRRFSSSPLMDPSVCALVILAPAPQDLPRIDPTLRSGYRRASTAVTKAAHIMNVPVFTLSRQPKKQNDARATSLRRQFVFEDHGCPWSQKDFVDALTAEDRSILILAGVWLEHQVLGTALHALAESYDVCVLIDATLPHSPHASQPARDRLNQAGATPVVTTQVVHEWIVAAPDPAKRAALNSLL